MRAVQGGGLARDAVHRGLHRRLQRGRGDARALRQAALQRLVHRRGQPLVGRLGLALEALLAGQQLLVRLLRLQLQLRHRLLQLLDQRRQQLRLLLLQPQRVFALVRAAEGAQRGGDAGIELQRGLQPLAPAQRRHQAEQRRGRHAGHRGAEGQPQAAHRRAQRIAHRLQVGGALQRRRRCR